MLAAPARSRLFTATLLAATALVLPAAPTLADYPERDVAAGLQQESVRAQFQTQGATPLGNTPAQFKQFMAQEAVKWAEVVKKSGAKVD